MLVPFMRRPNKKRGGGCVCVFWYLTHFRTLFPLWIPSLGHSLPLLCWASSDFMRKIIPGLKLICLQLTEMGGEICLILYQYLCLWASRNFSYRQDDMLSNFLPTLLPPSHHKIWFHISTIFGFLFSQVLISYFYNFWFLIFTIFTLFTLLSFLILCRFVQIAWAVFSCILGVRDALKYIFRYYVCWINLDYL